MKKAAVYSCVASFAVATPSADVLEKFHEFQAKWGHRYVGTEFARRAGYFADQLDRIETLQKQEQGTATYSHLGPFTDLSPDEMAQRSGLLYEGEDTELTKSRNVAPLLNQSVAASWDWVTKGAVVPIKNQGQCGSCWAFSTACNLEGTGFVSSHRLVSLSEQNIMDCDKTCHSCNGGLPSLALQWSASSGGVATEASYPYKAQDEACRSVGKITHNTNYVSISKSEDQIVQALVKYGPLSIGVDATPFQSYTGGILNSPSCSKTRLDHGVAIVGYGSASLPYWKVRNSWGASWGEAGYIRVARGNCMCGVCTMVVSATGVTVSSHPSPAPPSPPPPPCKDDYSWCPSIEKWECQFLAQDCKLTCGSCDANPSTVYNPRLFTPKSIFDEIKKLVCQYLANGTAEAEAQKLICSQFSSELAICDEVVQILWSDLEKECAPSPTPTPSSVVV